MPSAGKIGATDQTLENTIEITKEITVINPEALDVYGPAVTYNYTLAAVTEAELNQLANTPCDITVLKRAALFSALTGLRHCDIQKLRWSEVQKDGDSYRLNFTQQKTKEVEYMPISEQAYKLCGEPKEPCRLVFEDLTDAAWISKPLQRWLVAAGITRKITFHCFRHTFATLQLANGTDIYTVSKMLGHTNVKTTQIYAKVVNEKKEQAANAIKIAGL